jgi:hypothetical protein
VPITGSVAAVAMHAAHAIAVAELEILFAHTVITSLIRSLDRRPCHAIEWTSTPAH